MLKSPSAAARRWRAHDKNTATLEPTKRKYLLLNLRTPMDKRFCKVPMFRSKEKQTHQI